nr:hypothetical protein Iba_chr09bCG1050 [Ipomoea batatas]
MRNFHHKHNNRYLSILHNLEGIIFNPLLVSKISCCMLQACFFDTITSLQDTSFFNRFLISNWRKTDH